MVTRESSYFVSMSARVTYGFSAIKFVESLLVLVLEGGTFNPHQLVEICRLGIAHECVLAKDFYLLVKEFKICLRICKQ